MERDMKRKRRKSKHRKLPDLVYLRDHFVYDPIEGKLKDSDTLEEVGWNDDKGYRCVRIQKRVWKAHRIMFFMYHQRDPGPKVIDHIDGDKGNNQIFNLRAVTQRENSRNTQRQRDAGNVPSLERNAYKALL